MDTTERHADMQADRETMTLLPPVTSDNDDESINNERKRDRERAQHLLAVGMINE